MKRKPSSRKKHKELRRKRTADWDKSRRDMIERERIAEIQADKFIKEEYANRSDKT